MILITGATGFVGSYLTAQLLKKKHKLRLFKRTTSDETWFHRILKRELMDDYASALESIEWFTGDLLNVVDVHLAVKDVDAVYHAAALVSFDAKDKSALMDINVRGTAHVVNACLNASSNPTLLHISSTSAVGQAGNKLKPIKESDPVNPETQSLYGRSKSLAEREVERGREEGLKAAILNPTIILGYGDWDDGSSTFFKRASRGTRLYTDGANSFVDVRDVAACAIGLVEKELFEGRYLCVGWDASFKDLLSAMNDLFGHPPPNIRVQKALAELAWRLAWFQNLLGQRPFITRESASSSLKKMSFSNQKICKALGHAFHQQQDCLTHAINGYKKTGL